MTPKLLFSSVSFMAALSLMGGCATSQSGPGYFLRTKSDAIVYVDPATPAIRKIALMPFKAPTELIGGSVSELFVTELLKANRYTLVERSQMSRILNESELAMSGMTTAKAAEVGALVGADGVIIGTVDQYETTARKGHTYPVIGITLRLIDCKTSKIAWSVDLAKQADGKSATLSTHAREIVHEMMSGLYRDLIKYEAPEDPEALKVSDMGLGNAVLSWSGNPGRGEVYIVERAKAQDGPYVEIARPSASQRSYTDTGLESACIYYYRVTAVSSEGSKSKTVGPVETFTAGPPVAPAEVQAVSGCVKSIPLLWSRPKETMYVKGYSVMRASSSKGRFEKVGEVLGVNSLSYEDGGKEPGSLADDTEYLYQIVTINEAGTSSNPSSIVKATTRKAPPAVTGLSAKGDSPREVPLDWSQSPDEKVAGYIVARLNESSGQFDEIGRIQRRSSICWTDRGGEQNSRKIGRLADGQTYQYQIAAFNIGGAVSPWSKIVSARTKNTPHRPAAPAVTEGLVKSVKLSWQPNKESDISSYVIEYSTSESGRYKTCATQASREFIHEGLDDGSEYFYRIRAVDVDTLESDWSDSVSAMTKPCPDAPLGLMARESAEGYLLSWEAPSQQDISSYTIHKKSIMIKSKLGFSNETQYLLTPDQVGKSIEVYVSAMDKDGLESEYSEPYVITPVR